MIIVATIALYFVILLIFSRIASKGASDNDTFFRGNRRSPWYMVAYGMVGASISGVTLVSVPGMVLHSDMTYLQTCIGFIFGYFAVAFILLPIYYKFNLTTIYTYLDRRLGTKSYKTGASFFIISKLSGAAVRFYVICLILDTYVFEPISVPFAVTVTVMVALIWLYTRHGGIKTLVWTDTFQTTCLFGALLLIIYIVASKLGMSLKEAAEFIYSSDRSRIFVMDDFMSTQYFWKQFLSGIFIVIVMTGLDQDMMQKNLSCKSLGEAKKDMCTYGFAFVPANLLFLSLGLLLAELAFRQGLALPSSGDQLLPMFAASGNLGLAVLILFSIGIVAASFSSADSALTALTTSCCVDLFCKPKDEKLRKRVHAGLCFVFIIFILLFRCLNSTSVIDAIYIMCSYTYGPLLGLFAFAILTKRKADDSKTPFIAVASPLVCFVLDLASTRLFGYKFGYELLMLNGLLTFFLLRFFSTPKEKP